MNLSYTLRLVCVLIVAAAVALASAQCVVGFSARAILRRIERRSARERERVLYLVQMGPALLALVAALGLCMPAYLRFEVNRAVENVSLVCVLLAAGLGLWLASGVLRGMRIALRTQRFARACQQAGQVFDADCSLPVLAVPHSRRPLALAGFFHPQIFVSSDFLHAVRRLDPKAFAVALAHEASHARHRDNWKLLSLCFVPRMGRLVPGGGRWMPLWQTAADWAADDDAVAGDRGRSLQLAEVLVQAARCTRGSRSAVACTALTSAEEGLAARVERLTRPEGGTRRKASPSLAGLALLALLAGGAALALIPWIYSASERLLHLG
jgi:beta-lactamase regulating signal transducer with metallopeptidase domain